MTVVVDATVTAIVMNAVADVTVIGIAMTVGIGKFLWKSALRKSAFFVQEFPNLIY